MILLVLCNEFRGGKKISVVSHGVEEATLKNVILPNEEPRTLGASFDPFKGWTLPSLKEGAKK